MKTSTTLLLAFCLLTANIFAQHSHEPLEHLFEGKTLVDFEMQLNLQPSDYSNFPKIDFIDALFEVNRGGQNSWGIMNYVGNAQEWVIGPSGGYEARGGAYKDRLGTCKIELSRPHAGDADNLTGFRIVRELGGDA